MKRLCSALAALFSLSLLAGCSRSAGSIGIIGGADGPTAIYMTSPATRWVPVAFVFFVLAVIGIAFWIKRK